MSRERVTASAIADQEKRVKTRDYIMGFLVMSMFVEFFMQTVS